MNADTKYNAVLLNAPDRTVVLACANLARVQFWDVCGTPAHATGMLGEWHGTTSTRSATMIRKAATAFAAVVVLASAAGCSAPTEPSYPKDREEEPKPPPQPVEASLTLPATTLYA